jgi:YVTN family beta-propeller protein
MNFWRVARLLGTLILGLIAVSCGDQYRPVAVPIIPPPPDPQATHYVLVLSDNGALDPGASSRLDVSGDTMLSVAQLGLGPAHATLTANSFRVFAVNTREDSVSSFSPASGTTGTVVTTTSLPTGSIPVFVHTTENGSVYVANFGYGTVSAVSITSNAITATIPMDPTVPVTAPNPVPQPVALAETLDGKKLYAVNQGNGTVTAIAPIDEAVTRVIATGTTPVWAVTRSDSERVYVLNSGSGTVSAIDTSIDALLGSVPVGAGANYMVYDAKLNRLYVTNPVANTVTVLNASSDPPAVLFTVPVAPGPVTVAALADGSRVYAVSSTKTAPCTSNPADTQACISSVVTVINTGNGSIRKTIPLEPTVNINAVSLGSTGAIYSYTLISGPDVRPGESVVVTGMTDAANNGTFTVAAANAGTFTVPNPSGVAASGQSGTGTAVVEISTANPTGCDVPGPGLPGGVLGGVRFRFSSVASADSTKVFIGKCDSGSTAVIRTSDDTPVIDMAAPLSTITAPSGGTPPPQNPVFVLAGP